MKVDDVMHINLRGCQKYHARPSACPAAAVPPTQAESAHKWHKWPQGVANASPASLELYPFIWERIAEEWFRLDEWVRTAGSSCRALQHVQHHSLTLGSRKDAPGAWRSPLQYLARHWQGCQHITLYVVVGGLNNACMGACRSASCKLHASHYLHTAQIPSSLTAGRAR